MPDNETVNIDMSKLSDVAHTGVRRAVLFMGLGLNAANREEFNDYELHKIPIVPGQTSLPIDFFPAELPPERVKAFKEEFATWIVGCGLRELLEHYALFLDQMHRYGLLVLQTRGMLGGIDPQKEQDRFNRRLGIPDKLVKLHDRFSITPSYPESIKQLYQARNCLTHELGVVSPKRCGPDGHFTMTWRAYDFLAEGEESGIVCSMTELIDKEIQEETRLFMQATSRERKFVAGARLLLSQQDLWEICYFFNAMAIPTAAESFIAFLKGHGIQTEDGK